MNKWIFHRWRNAHPSAVMPGRGNRHLRQIDRYLGIPLVWSFGLLHKKRVPPTNPRVIGVLNTAAIGDTILMSAAVADLREAYKRSRLILFVGPSNYEAAGMIEGPDQVVKLEVFRPLQAIREIRKYGVEILLDFAPWARLNAILTYFSGADFTIGFNTSGQYRHFIYDRAVVHSAERHEIDNYSAIVTTLGIKPQHRPSVAFEDRGIDFSHRPHQPYVVFHMWPGGSGAEYKEWPTERWLALARELSDRGYRIVLTGAPSQRALNRAFTAGAGIALRPFIVNRAGISLPATARLLSGATLVVSVNTGIIHLADVIHVPLVALHGPTSVKRWGPLSSSSISLEPQLPGCGYLDLGFEYPRNPPKCMAAVSYSQVLEASNIALHEGVAHRSADTHGQRR